MRHSSSIIISPISAECQLVPHAVIVMLSTLEQLLLRDVEPPELREALLEHGAPRIVF
jgi:hypothetical protein